MSTIAQRMHDGDTAKDLAEDAVETEFGHLGVDFDIGCDRYDNSLEITIRQNREWLADEGFASVVWSMGFSRFWVNWPDGTEQLCYLHEGVTQIGERKSKN